MDVKAEKGRQGPGAWLPRFVCAPARYAHGGYGVDTAGCSQSQPVQGIHFSFVYFAPDWGRCETAAVQCPPFQAVIPFAIEPCLASSNNSATFAIPDLPGPTHQSTYVPFHLATPCVCPPTLRDIIMAMRPASRQPVGSTAWCVDERSSALQIAQSEVEEFGYSARNEVEWLNEHMAEIFSENQMCVSDASDVVPYR